MYGTAEEAAAERPEVAEALRSYRESVAAHRAEQEVRSEWQPPQTTSSEPRHVAASYCSFENQSRVLTRCGLLPSQSKGGRPKELLPPGRLLHLLSLGRSEKHRRGFKPVGHLLERTPPGTRCSINPKKHQAK